MEGQKELTELLKHLEEKLDYTRRLIAEYDEAMDYASYCNLQGFAEGIEFAIEEIREMTRPPKAAKKNERRATRVGTQAKVASKMKTRTKEKS